MAWTTPTTRSSGELITAAIWNTDLVDNLKYLKGSPVIDTAVIIGAATTSGIRLDLESGTLAVREGDDSAYGLLIVGKQITTSGASGDYNVLQMINVGGAEVHLVANGTSSGDLRTITNHPLLFLTNNTERMRIPAAGGVQSVTTISVGNATPASTGAGITFPAAQSASSDANTLDDYEEGTWTPTVSGSTSAGTGTYTVQVGSYTKIGNLVTCTAYVTWTAHTGTGDLRFSNLPFASANVTNRIWAATLGYVNNIALTAGNIMMANLEPNNQAIEVWQSPTGGGAMSRVPMDTAGAVIFSINYQTA